MCFVAAQPGQQNHCFLVWYFAQQCVGEAASFATKNDLSSMENLQAGLSWFVWSWLVTGAWGLLNGCITIIVLSRIAQQYGNTAI